MGGGGNKFTPSYFPELAVHEILVYPFDQIHLEQSHHEILKHVDT